MIEIKINDKLYSIKTEWKEFSFKEYCVIISASTLPILEKISTYTGLPLPTIEKLNLEQLSFICDAVGFMEQPDNALLFAEAFSDDLNIGRRTYKELEQSLIFLRKVENPLTAIDKVVKIYYDEDIADLPALKVLGKCTHVLNLISKFVAEFKRLNEYEPTIEELEAGVEELSKFGFFGTAVQFARKYGQTHDEILKMPAREVYTTLLYDFEQSEVERKLNQIRSKKK